MSSHQKRNRPAATISPARLGPALKYSLNGLRAAWQGEAAFRQEALLVMVLVPVAIWLGESGLHRSLLLGSLLLVLLTELLNSAIEAAVDRQSEEYHPLAGQAKDLGSAAVFIALLNAVVIWSLLIYDRFS